MKIPLSFPSSMTALTKIVSNFIDMDICAIKLPSMSVSIPPTTAFTRPLSSNIDWGIICRNGASLTIRSRLSFSRSFLGINEYVKHPNEFSTSFSCKIEFTHKSISSLDTVNSCLNSVISSWIPSPNLAILMLSLAALSCNPYLINNLWSWL